MVCFVLFWNWMER
ncbi:UNVERIFIED_CONTAM: hypothetical protein GTU68_027879 [Idotea baltica]|nr:hypothetical protein [Idotea baltica]